MRWAHVMISLFAVLTLCGCSNDDSPCTDSECVHPPAATCMDADTLRKYQPQGACDPGTGDCAYEHTDRTCDYGCSVDRCDSSDPCTGVVCDQPPDNRCDDASNLRIYDAQGTCIRPQGTCDYGYTVQGCPDSCVLGACRDLGDDFALAVPSGTRVCNDKRSTWDVFGDYHNRMRITFRAGTVSLPTDEDSFERAWVESIEFGPDREILTPMGTGTFTRSAGVDRMEYQFVQAFSDGEQTYTLTYDVWFDTTDPEDRVRVFDELYLSPPLTYPPTTLELVVDGAEFERWYFLTCTFDLYLPVLHRVVTEDGALLELEERTYPSPDHCMLACPTGIRRAGFELAPDLREVQDPFRLSFVDGQHNWHDQFLVVFDEPVGEIHAVYFYPADNEAPEKKVDYLDAALEVNGQSLVVSHHTVELRNSFDSEAIPVDTCGEYCRDYVGLAEDCEDSCVLEGQALAGRCLPTGGWPPDDDWTPIDSCNTTFDACVAAGKPFIQCCCSRIAGDW